MLTAAAAWAFGRASSSPGAPGAVESVATAAPPVAIATPAAAPSEPPPALLRTTPVLGPVHPLPATTRWLAFAGGPTPEFNQVSLEQDLALVRETFGDDGYVMFGAGAGSPTVQVLAAREGDPVIAALSDLLAPRGGRDADYRVPSLQVDAPATADGVHAALRDAVATAWPDLLVWVGGHGHQGQTARDNATDLWGHGELTVAQLADILDGAQRTVRVVSTTCFGGGLGELVFAGADETRGAAGPLRCGVFAAPWDLEATGCDPNPDRTAQEGYALHLLHALRGEDRHGKTLPRTEIDFDGDGSISLAEAHARVRLAAETADVPTTTSERWLRHAAPERGDGREVALPEEEAVIRGLARRLGLDGREHEAEAELIRREDQIVRLSNALDEAHAAEDLAFTRAAADLLARWPVLDDPWHPDFAQTLRDHHDGIAHHLETSETYLDYLDARAAVDRESTALWDLRAEAAPYERLARAVLTRKLAARLHAQGGPAWERYEALLACERATPL
jgi:hypothetical protein